MNACAKSPRFRSLLTIRSARATVAVMAMAAVASAMLSDVAGATEPPRCLRDGMTIELVLAEPDLVTPIACRFDARGRLYVIESHTHFPLDDYAGLPHDRIKLIDDTDGDGKLDRVRVFHEGTVKTMGLAIADDGWVYVATRDRIVRMRDSDSDDVADATETLIELHTTADYPHNGLSGLWLDGPAANPTSLVFGMGENFGAPYRMVARDGSAQSGGGEGGNVFRCTPDGNQLERVATGFWNPFGICRDPAGRLLMVGNDADAMPPCRIAEVVEQGDYGFQFRFGRAGTHPLQAWDGELPGTLPMVAGTGEAPCAILPFRGEYWVTSWGDNRIECYRPRAHGASILAEQSVAVVGDAMFRPVDMAVAPDGSIYVTDWVDRSYNVHGKGRLWRIRFSDSEDTATTPASDGVAIDRLSAAELSARSLDATDATTRPADATGGAAHLERAIVAMATDDPFLWQRAARAASSSDAFFATDGLALDDSRARLGWLMAWRWRELVSSSEDGDSDARDTMLRRALEDPSEDVRIAAVRWIAERRIVSLQAALEGLLYHEKTSARLLAPTVAALSYLEMGEVEAGGFDQLTRQRLAEFVAETGAPAELRLTALELVPPDSELWTPELLVSLIRQSDEALARGAGRHLAVAAKTVPAMQQAAQSLLHDEAIRPEVRQDLAATVQQAAPATNAAGAAPSAEASKAVEEDLAKWMQRVGSGGDADNGWRVFFGNQGGQCAACHTLDGRGANVGPDLTSLRGVVSRKKILESILHPSREIAPMYVPWKLVTSDGRVLVGLKLNGGGVANRSRYLAADASTFDVELTEIEFQDVSDQSIMPSGLEKLISVEQLRDLLALLEADL